jgi:hypothetical protein
MISPSPSWGWPTSPDGSFVGARASGPESCLASGSSLKNQRRPCRPKWHRHTMRTSETVQRSTCRQEVSVMVTDRDRGRWPRPHSANQVNAHNASPPTVWSPAGAYTARQRKHLVFQPGTATHATGSARRREERVETDWQFNSDQQRRALALLESLPWADIDTALRIQEDALRRAMQATRPEFRRGSRSSARSLRKRSAMIINSLRRPRKSRRCRAKRSSPTSHGCSEQWRWRMA